VTFLHDRFDESRRSFTTVNAWFDGAVIGFSSTPFRPELEGDHAALNTRIAVDRLIAWLELIENHVYVVSIMKSLTAAAMP